MNRRAATIAMCMLMVVSTAPLTNAEGQEESSIWGITYDWSHFEGDAFNMTGVDVNDLNADLSAAAEYAGFDMDYDEVLSGTTQFFVESWDEAGPFTVTTEDGSSHQVGKRITELTVRHGSMADTGMATNWSDGGEKIEAWLSAYQDYMLVMNANYVEYVDEARAPAPRYAQMTLSQQRRRFGVDDYRAFRESVCSQPPHNWYDSKPAVGAY